jgi:hypothetical protein
MSWIDKLQTRWKVKSAFQVIIILIVFACTGFTVMFLKPVITHFLFSGGRTTWFSILYWVLIFPVYNLFLLFYGFIFGQSKFFWEFEKKFFNRMFGKRKKE